MGWELNVPKILHVYWGGGTLHYLRFLTVKTFMKFNPDWEVKFYYPLTPTMNVTWNTGENNYQTICKDFTSELMELPITKIEVDFTVHGFDNGMPEVHKSDFIRLHQLSTDGGVWSDMDILYFKPMSDLYFNTPGHKDIKTFYCNHNYGHSIGFLMSSENNEFFAKLAEYSLQNYYPGNYQSIGAHIWNRYFCNESSINQLTPAMNISMDVVYAHDATHLDKIINGNETRFTSESIGIHWYAGAPEWSDFMKSTNGGLTNLPDNIIGNLLKNEQ